MAESDDTGVHNIRSLSEYKATLADHKVVIIDCFAVWCGPCKVIAPTIVKFAKDYPDAYFAKVDVDEVPDVAQELGVRAMPTFKVFKDGLIVDDVVGANPGAVKAAVESALA